MGISVTIKLQLLKNFYFVQEIFPESLGPRIKNDTLNSDGFYVSK